MLTFKCFKSEDPLLIDDIYECVEYPEYHIQVSNDDIKQSRFIVYKETKKDDSFVFKEIGNFNSLNQAKLVIEMFCHGGDK